MLRTPDRGSPEVIDVVKYPSNEELDRQFTDDELRAHDPLWVACWCFNKIPDQMNSGIKVSDTFPKLTHDEVDQLVSQAAFWWTQRKRKN